MTTPKKNLRVIIVGGSIAGLTLAHSLQRCGIDFVVLEANDDIAPQVGASIGILANGARVLDQLGVFDDVSEEIVPAKTLYYWSDTAKLITKEECRVLEERHNYPIAFLDRQILLRILFAHLGDYQDRVHLSKKVVRVENLPTKAVAHCADGSVFEGDLIVGADGVRSTVRQEMWRHMESLGLTKEVAKEKAIMISEYSCVFGISNPTPGVNAGDAHRTYAKGYSTLTIGGKGGRVYWFLFTKMDQSYSGSNVPRFNEEDLEAHIANYLQLPITPTVPFSAVYARVECKAYLPLEEAFYRYWSVDRCVCIGDSVHKMTPNIGQGGNSAIETAASLANCLARLVEPSDGDNSVSLRSINANLQDWQKARQTRAKNILTIANDVTRLEAGATLKDTFISQYLLPYVSGLLTDSWSKIVVAGEILDFLPLTPRAVEGTMPYVRQADQNEDYGSIVKRMLSCVPLIGCYAYAHISMTSLFAKVFPMVVPLLQQGTWTASNGEVLSLTEPLYHISFLDKLVGPLITCFLPSISGSHPQSYTQMLSFLTDVGPIYGIWLLESYRKAHSWTEIALPIVMATAFQFKGIGLIAPIYFTIEHLRTPLAKLLNGRHELKPDTLGSFLPAMLAGYYVPNFGNFLPRTVAMRRYFNALWQVFPITVPLLQTPFRLLEKYASQPAQAPQQEKDEAKRNSTKNLRYVRCMYLSLAVISGATFIHARRTLPAGAPVTSLFLPGLQEYKLPISSFAEGIATFLKYDETIAMASGLVWLGLKFKELKQFGHPVSWWKVIGGLAGTTAAFGPGAAISLGWGWREEILAKISREEKSRSGGN
ncbi:hypothetical protein BBP40_001367 [Aspergillus hancockii]|nr:hypothetical protein BBP40_001367 [Aspergillus hancockii]